MRVRVRVPVRVLVGVRPRVGVRWGEGTRVSVGSTCAGERRHDSMALPSARRIAFQLTLFCADAAFGVATSNTNKQPNRRNRRVIPDN